MNARASAFLTSVTLATWGGSLAWFGISGRIAAYLHPAFHPWVLASGIVLLALAAGALGVPQPGKLPRPRPALSFLVLVVPLVAAMAVSPGRFGATAVANRGLVDDPAQLAGVSGASDPALARVGGPVAEGTMMDPDAYLKKTADGRIRVQTVDLLYASAEPTMREDFENKEIEVIGQFMPARLGNPNGDRFQLVRLFVMCCAADARPVAVAVESRETFPEMTWLRVTGRATFPVVSGRRSPVVVADSVKVIDPPEESFIY
jgi:uncharacterized repeat protein (TIGR03943 family)